MARMARLKDWTWPKCFGSNYHAATRIRAGEGEMKRGSYRAVLLWLVVWWLEQGSASGCWVSLGELVGLSYLG